MRNTIVLSSLFLVLGAAYSWAQSDTFAISKNLFSPGASVDIQVSVTNYPNAMSLKVYNTAGELVKVLEDTSMNNAYSYTYQWDGTNTNNTKVAGGVYLIVLKTDQYTKKARILAAP